MPMKTTAKIAPPAINMKAYLSRSPSLMCDVRFRKEVPTIALTSAKDMNFSMSGPFGIEAKQQDQKRYYKTDKGSSQS